MSALRKYMNKRKIILFEQDKICLDNFFFPPFQTSEERYDSSRIYETDNKSKQRKLDLLYISDSIFSYFMDGSRKVYKIADTVTSGSKFMPVVAGQVAVGCCKRVNGNMERFLLDRKNYVLLSMAINSEDFEYIKQGYERDMQKKMNITVEKYDFDRSKTDKPVDAAIAKIQKFMQDSEVSMLTSMVKKGVLDTDNLLIIDGSLQFLSQKFNPDIFYNVVGVSKTFNPNSTEMTKGKIHIGALLIKLEFAERTPVLYSSDKSGRYEFGVWFVRIRKPHRGNPLDGIVKVEKMVLKDDKDRDGFETNLIDNISISLISERNPTCHGRDERWTNHLYPVYLTERMVKASFMSDIHFQNLV